MNRTADIAIATVMWCGIVLYIGAAGYAYRRGRAAVTVKELRIEIVDTATLKLVTRAKAMRWLREGGIAPVGSHAAEVDTRAIENYLATHPEVQRASAWCDLDGTLTVRIAQRRPALRIRTEGGYRFWLTRDGVIIPDRGDFGAYTPVVTGAIPFPFGPSAQGRYSDLARAEYNDFLGRFSALETQRRTTLGELTSTRARIREVRGQRARFWWGKERKKLFAEHKAALVEGLRKTEESLEGQLSSLAAQRRALGEKEKKSQQSFAYLPKLANFVQFVERDDFWAAQIVQINALATLAAASSAGRQGRSERWHEPQLELVPRAGDHTVLLGRLDGGEAARLEKLHTFYLDGMRHDGWDNCRLIDIRFEDQIVCTK